MKKRLLLSIGLFIFSLTVSLISLFYVSKTTNQVLDGINSVQDHVSKREYAKASEEMETLKQIWKGSHSILEIFVNHEMFEDIDKSISSISTSIDKRQLNNFWMEYSKMTSSLDNLRDSEKISIGNIL